MQDLTDDAATAASAMDDHAEIIALMTSDAWNRRLEEARRARSRVLAQRGRPASVSVFRRGPARRDLLPPLEPAAVQRPVGSVIRLVPQVSPPAAHPLPVSAAAPRPDRRVALWLACGFVAGLMLGVVLPALF